MSEFSEKRLWSIMSDDEDDNRYPCEEPFYYQDKYLYDYHWYHISFPKEWAVNHHNDETGPKCCLNCECFGSINGIFIGYCVNCAQYVYNGSRGRGFIDVGVEINHEEVDSDSDSVFDTYLKDVDIWAIEPIDEEEKEKEKEEEKEKTYQQIIDQKH